MFLHGNCNFQVKFSEYSICTGHLWFIFIFYFFFVNSFLRHVYKRWHIMFSFSCCCFCLFFTKPWNETQIAESLVLLHDTPLSVLPPSQPKGRGRVQLYFARDALQTLPVRVSWLQGDSSQRAPGAAQTRAAHSGASIQQCGKYRHCMTLCRWLWRTHKSVGL